MDDRNRITQWLQDQDQWLISEKNRIEKVAKKGEQCSIESRTVTRNEKKVTQKALFYTNGFYENGEWVAAEDSCGVAA